MTERPTDIREELLWFYRDVPGGFTAWAEPNPDAHPAGCRAFWGSHGCSRPRGHDGAHWCDCCECVDHPDDPGCVAGPPYYGADTRFYGEDA